MGHNGRLAKISCVGLLGAGLGLLCVTVLLGYYVGGNLTGRTFYNAHSAFFDGVAGSVGLSPLAFADRSPELGRGATFSVDSSPARADVVRSLGPPTHVDSRGHVLEELGAPSGAVSSLQYRDGDALAYMMVDAEDRVIAVVTFDVEYFL